jgi:hypothetical protein
MCGDIRTALKTAGLHGHTTLIRSGWRAVTDSANDLRTSIRMTKPTLWEGEHWKEHWRKKREAERLAETLANLQMIAFRLSHPHCIIEGEHYSAPEPPAQRCGPWLRVPNLKDERAL